MAHFLVFSGAICVRQGPGSRGYMQAGDIVAGRFQVDRKAGAGGMGVVYRAKDRVSGSTIALKILHDAHSINAERFAREASLLAQLQHPAIVRYIAHGQTEGGEYYLAMEWLDGESLSERLRRTGLTIAETITVIQRLAEALATAHRRGILHRDIKPQNILLLGGEAARVRLLDFGIARSISQREFLTRTGAVVGTPGYMSPEQARGDRDLDASSDVFSLGALFYLCLTGKLPFYGGSPLAVIAKLVLAEVPRIADLRPNVPPEVEALVMRMLAKDPEGRPKDAGVVAEALAKLDVVPASAKIVSRTLAITEDEQRVVCIVLVGQGDISEAPTWSSDMHGPLEAQVSAKVARGGKVERFADGSLLVTFAGQSGATDQAVLAARCALELRGLRPKSSIVVATGRAILAGQLPVGEVIDRAVELLATTQADEIRIDALTRTLLDERFVVTIQGDRSVLEGEREGGTVRLLLGKPSPFVGRAREMAMIEGLFAECTEEPVARAVLLTGPAGRGKSRLRVEFLRKLKKDGLDIFTARGDVSSAGSPFSMAAQIVRSAAGIVEGDPMEDKQAHLAARVSRSVSGMALRRTIEFLGEIIGVRSTLAASQKSSASNAAALIGDGMRFAWLTWLKAECERHPVVLVLEDLHYGDRPTIDFVGAALRALRERPLFVLAIGRPEIFDRFPNLWSDREPLEVKLGPLTRKASESFVREVLRGRTIDDAQLERVIERAEGNAFFLEELIRALDAGSAKSLPESVLGMVESRLQELSGDAKRVLRAASVFGGRFWRNGVTELCGGAHSTLPIDECLMELSARELITPLAETRVPQDKEYAFRNELVRESAYAMLTDNDRALGHRLAGAWLERVGFSDPLALAGHFDRGGNKARASHWYQRGAEQALGGHDLEEAISLARLAETCGAEGESVAELHLVKAEASNWKGDHEGGYAEAVKAASQFPRGSAGWFRAADEALMASGRQAKIEQAAEWLQQICTTEPRPDARNEQVAALARAAIVIIRAGREELAQALIAQVIAIAGGMEKLEPMTKGRVVAVRALLARANGDAEACLRDHQEAHEIHASIGDLRTICLNAMSTCSALMELGDEEGAENVIRPALDDAVRLGLGASIALCRFGLVYAIHARRPEEARGHAERAKEEAQRYKEPLIEAYASLMLARILTAMGHLEEAEAEAAYAVSKGASSPTERARGQATFARILVARGKIAAALETAHVAVKSMRTTDGFGGGESDIRLAEVEALLAAGQMEEAKAALKIAVARLRLRADKIPTPRWRSSFLDRVPEHVRTFQLAKELGV